MGKLANLLKPKALVVQVHSSGKCDACGWDFARKRTEEIIKADGTKVQRPLVRDQIRIPIKRNGEVTQIVTRCGDCYERETFNSKKSRWTGCEAVETLHRQSFGIEP